MMEEPRQFEPEDEFAVTPEFRRDLRALFPADKTVPPEVDRAILQQARAHFGRVKRPMRQYRLWAWRGMAAAAVILVVFGAWLVVKPPGSPSMPAVLQVREDIDGNGRVDILDAFVLARRLENDGKIDPSCDFNDDGLVDRRDVDVIASAAVRVQPGA